jgi:hypothetical protein
MQHEHSRNPAQKLPSGLIVQVIHKELKGKCIRNLRENQRVQNV